MAEKKTIWVQSTVPTKPDGADETLLWEKDAEHPKGEAYIAGPHPVEVGETGAVAELLRSGKVKKVDAPKTAAAARGSETTRTSSTTRTTTSAPKDEDKLEDDFPGVDVLRENKVTTYGQLRALSPSQVKEFKGIGDKTLSDIDAALSGK